MPHGAVANINHWPDVHSIWDYCQWCSRDIEPMQQHQTQDVYSMLVQCWPDIYDVDPTLKQHWVNISCLLGAHLDHIFTTYPSFAIGVFSQSCSGISIRHQVITHIKLFKWKQDLAKLSKSARREGGARLWCCNPGCHLSMRPVAVGRRHKPAADKSSGVHPQWTLPLPAPLTTQPARLNAPSAWRWVPW